MKRIAVAAIVFFSILALYGEGPSLMYLRTSDSRTLDPGKTQDKYSGEVVANMFQGLVRYARDGHTIEACLAENWTTTPDRLTWTFSLRPDVRFHNGNPLTAAAVVQSFGRRMDSGSREYPKWRLFFPTIVDVHAGSDRQVIIRLSHPFAPLLTALTDPVAFIVAPAAYRENRFIPIGTGPFRFSEWQPGKHIRLTRHPGYWEHEVTIRQIVFRVVPDPGDRVHLLKTGQADVIEARSADEYSEFLGDRSVRTISHPPNGVFFLAFNMRRKPFDSLPVRRAIAHLLNKKVLVRQVFQRFATPATTPIPPQINGHNLRIEHYPFDIGEARRLLAAAGYSSGFTCSVYFQDGDVGEQRIVDALARNARLVGITIKKVPQPFQTLLQTARAGGHDILLRGWVAGPDPDIYLFANFTLQPGNHNWTMASDNDIVRLLKKARTAVDNRQRWELYARVQELIFQRVPWIPLYHLHYMTIHRRDVKPLYFDSNSFILFKDANKSPASPRSN